MSHIRCLKFDVWYSMFDFWLPCSMSDVRCKMSNVRCLMSDVWSLMFDVRCLILDVRCLMSDVWCLTSDIRCLMSDDTARSIIFSKPSDQKLMFTLIKKFDSTSSSCQLSVLWIRFWKIWTKIKNTSVVKCQVFSTTDLLTDLFFFFQLLTWTSSRKFVDTTEKGALKLVK